MQKYTGITVGPIIRTLNMASNTGELWGASYIFSYIVRQLIEKINKTNKIIIPHYDKDTLDHIEAGLLPDRIIVEGQVENMHKHIDEVIKKISKEIKRGLNNVQNNDLYSYLKNYFQIYYIEREIDNNKNIIFEINEYLDVLELKQAYIPKETKSYILDYIENGSIKTNVLIPKIEKNENEKKKESILIPTKENGNEKVKYRFPALMEIGTVEFLKKYPYIYDLEVDSKDFHKKLKEELKALKENEKMRKAHKYYAIVQADGDNVGKVIETLKSKEQYKNFSKNIFDFAKNAVNIIKNNNGLPVYAGGDDLLFIMPLIYKSKNIFKVVDELNEEFKKSFDISNKDVLSLSFGISMNYHKYPLYEALEEARTLLFAKAKKHKTRDGKEKNAVAFKLTKHSGKEFNKIFQRESNTYKIFKEMLLTNLDSKILTSIHIKIFKDKFIINEIIHDKNKLKNYFKNNFNEDIHEENNHYIEKVQQLMNTYFIEHNGDELIEEIYSILRFIKFIREEDS